jgi:two-component sensor histidine kinase
MPFETLSSDPDSGLIPLETVSDAQLLLREFTHRINNELTSVICMVALAASRSRTRRVKQALNEVQERLHAYALVQHTLQMPEHVTLVDGAAYLRQLCRAMSRAKLDFRKIDLLFVERPILMSCDRCWRLGLIVSELITNSARHAFGDAGGSIRVELIPLRAILECQVTDNGTCEPRIGSGHGRFIIEGLVRSLGGTITQRFGADGSESIVRIPLKTDNIGSPSASREMSAWAALRVHRAR